MSSKVRIVTVSFIHPKEDLDYRSEVDVFSRDFAGKALLVDNLHFVTQENHSNIRCVSFRTYNFIGITRLLIHFMREVIGLRNYGVKPSIGDRVQSAIRMIFGIKFVGVNSGDDLVRSCIHLFKTALSEGLENMKTVYPNIHEYRRQHEVADKILAILRKINYDTLKTPTVEKLNALQQDMFYLNDFTNLNELASSFDLNEETASTSYYLLLRESENQGQLEELLNSIQGNYYRTKLRVSSSVFGDVESSDDENINPYNFYVSNKKPNIDLAPNTAQAITDLLSVIRAILTQNMQKKVVSAASASAAVSPSPSAAVSPSDKALQESELLKLFGKKKSKKSKKKANNTTVRKGIASSSSGSGESSSGDDTEDLLHLATRGETVSRKSIQGVSESHDEKPVSPSTEASSIPNPSPSPPPARRLTDIVKSNMSPKTESLLAGLQQIKEKQAHVKSDVVEEKSEGEKSDVVEEKEYVLPESFTESLPTSVEPMPPFNIKEHNRLNFCSQVDPSVFLHSDKRCLFLVTNDEFDSFINTFNHFHITCIYITYFENKSVAEIEKNPAYFNTTRSRGFVYAPLNRHSESGVPFVDIIDKEERVCTERITPCFIVLAKDDDDRDFIERQIITTGKMNYYEVIICKNNSFYKRYFIDTIEQNINDKHEKNQAWIHTQIESNEIDLETERKRYYYFKRYAIKTRIILEEIKNGDIEDFNRSITELNKIKIRLTKWHSEHTTRGGRLSKRYRKNGYKSKKRQFMKMR
jgi:hypothetical protein